MRRLKALVDRILSSGNFKEIMEEFYRRCINTEENNESIMGLFKALSRYDGFRVEELGSIELTVASGKSGVLINNNSIYVFSSPLIARDKERIFWDNTYLTSTASFRVFYGLERNEETARSISLLISLLLPLLAASLNCKGEAVLKIEVLYEDKREKDEKEIILSPRFVELGNKMAEFIRNMKRYVEEHGCKSIECIDLYEVAKMSGVSKETVDALMNIASMLAEIIEKGTFNGRRVRQADLWFIGNIAHTNVVAPIMLDVAVSESKKGHRNLSLYFSGPAALNGALAAALDLIYLGLPPDLVKPVFLDSLIRASALTKFESGFENGDEALTANYTFTCEGYKETFYIGAYAMIDPDFVKSLAFLRNDKEAIKKIVEYLEKQRENEEEDVIKKYIKMHGFEEKFRKYLDMGGFL